MESKEIITCFKTGNSKALNEFLNSSVELRYLMMKMYIAKHRQSRLLIIFLTRINLSISS